MRHFDSRGVALLAALLMLPVSTAVATTVVHLEDEQLVEASERIVHGKVVAVTANVAKDGERCFTEYRIEVVEILKGGEIDTTEVTFREWGATMPEGWGYWIPGVGRFDVGEEIVVFLGEVDEVDGVGFTTGLAQGKFHIVREGGKATATRRFRQLELVDSSGKRVAPDKDSRDLDELKATVHAHIKRQK